jgi:hypothetical protein
MRRFVLTIACIFTAACVAMVGQTARADHGGLGFARFGGIGWADHDFGGWHDGFELGGLRPFGLGGLHDGLGFYGFAPFGWGHFGYPGLDPERLQMHFENKYEDLMTEYDTGQTDIEDFFNSDEYTKIVDDTQRLVDRYDLFLGGFERTVDRLGDIIGIFNDDLTYVMDLLEEYQGRDDLSEQKLERITAHLTHAEEHLTEKIDRLTEKQTTLSENLDTYQMFSEDLSQFLTDIVEDGGGTPDASEAAAEMLASTSALAAAPETLAVAESMSLPAAAPFQSAVAAAAVPEPCSGVLFAIAAAALAMRRSPRRGPSA